MERAPYILDIKGNSLDDGPGIRSVIFFKGCPLSCTWCHNPESKLPDREISHDPTKCIGCGVCAETCRYDAVQPDSELFIDRGRCTLCFECIDPCPSGALAMVGRSMGIEEIFDAVIRDKPFFDSSGGGVTLSGGEPAMHPEFIGGLLEKCRQHGMSTLIETSGCFRLEKFIERVLPFTDMIYFDIKIFDPFLHEKQCGVPNAAILSHFKKLLELSRKGGFTLLPRIPLVPGITDTEENLGAIADYLSASGVTEASLLDYNPLWIEKARNLGAPPSLSHEDMKNFLPRGQLEKAGKIFSGRGIRT